MTYSHFTRRYDNPIRAAPYGKDMARELPTDQRDPNQGLARRQSALLRLSAEISASIDEQEICERIVSGLRDSAMRALSGMGVLDRIPANQQFELRKDAIDAAVDYCLAQSPQPAPPGEQAT